MATRDDSDRTDLRARATDLAMSLYPLSENQVDILIAHARREGSPTDLNRAVRVKELLNEARRMLHEIGDGRG